MYKFSKNMEIARSDDMIWLWEIFQTGEEIAQERNKSQGRLQKPFKGRLTKEKGAKNRKLMSYRERHSITQKRRKFRSQSDNEVFERSSQSPHLIQKNMFECNSQV